MTVRECVRLGGALGAVFTIMIWVAPAQSARAGDNDTAGTGDRPALQDRPVEKPGSDIFGFDAGVQGSYSDGVSSKSFYYQPFANLYLKHTYVRFTAGVSRFQDYQITDGEGEFETVNFTQPKLALSLMPHRTIELFGEYYYSTGDKTHYYRSHEGIAGFLLDFDVVTIGATAAKSRTEYHFKSDDRLDRTMTMLQSYTALGLWVRHQYFTKRRLTRFEDLTVYPELSWFVHETTSIDAKYQYSESIFEYVPEDYQYHHTRYYTHTGRLGLYSEPCRYFALQAGITAGKDKEDYIIAGGDIGVTFNLFDWVLISSSYAPEYYMAPKMDPTKRKIMEVLSLAILRRRGNANPFMQLSSLGTSFWNHGVSISAMFTY